MNGVRELQIYWWFSQFRFSTEIVFLVLFLTKNLLFYQKTVFPMSCYTPSEVIEKKKKNVLEVDLWTVAEGCIAYS